MDNIEYYVFVLTGIGLVATGFGVYPRIKRAFRSPPPRVEPRAVTPRVFLNDGRPLEFRVMVNDRLYYSGSDRDEAKRIWRATKGSRLHITDLI